MAAKIQEMRATIVEQTQMVQTLRSERDSSSEVINALYRALVQFKPQYAAKIVSISGIDYPDLRAEDIAKKTTPELIRSIGATFSSLCQSAEYAAEQYRVILRELDEGVDDAMAQWQTVRAQGSNNSKATLFRDHSATPSQDARAKTPEVPLGNSFVPNGRSTPTAAVVDTPTKSQPDGTNKTSKAKTSTIAKLMGDGKTSPTKTDANAKTTGKK